MFREISRGTDNSVTRDLHRGSPAPMRADSPEVRKQSRRSVPVNGLSSEVSGVLRIGTPAGTRFTEVQLPRPHEVKSPHISKAQISPE